MASTMANAVFPRSHVGFDSITQQIERKLLKRGFQFNVICVGMYQEDHTVYSDMLMLYIQVKLGLENPLSSTPFLRRT
jgi:hypothetical protein